MKKRIYLAPAASVAHIHSEATMLTTSTGTENYAINNGADAWKSDESLGEYGMAGSRGGDIYLDNWN
jgi:hypothetical protein